MKTIFCGVFLALFISLFMTACNDRSLNGSSEPLEVVETAEPQNGVITETAKPQSDIIVDGETGFLGDVLDGSDTNTAAGGESAGADEEQEPVDKEGDTFESVPKDNTPDSDLIAPPANGSSGVL